MRYKIVIFQLLIITIFGSIKLRLPNHHTAFSHDLKVKIITNLTQISYPELLLLQLIKVNLTLYQLPIMYENITVNFSCNYFNTKSMYIFRIIRNDTKSIIDEQYLSVKWPAMKITALPNYTSTFSNQSIIVILERKFIDKLQCLNTDAVLPKQEIILQYCGVAAYDCVKFINDSNNLYSISLNGFPQRKIITLHCNYFGLAGYYQLTFQRDFQTEADTVIEVEWNREYSFSVFAKSIFPCDIHSGIKVIFQYPQCILESGDRIRVYGRLRANVASVNAPSYLEYVNEKRFRRGEHNLLFDCEVFSEKYVEYCFVYVTETKSGAMANIKTDCVPTLPITGASEGDWGPWSDWSQCSSKCFGGTRTRYRFCDSPLPKFGGKYCTGMSVETESCGNYSWDCFYDKDNSKDIDFERESLFETSNRCRCGCIIHLTKSKPIRYIGATSHHCSGVNYWFIQAELDHIIHIKIKQYRMLCEDQWLKIRNGENLSDQLLLHLENSFSGDKRYILETENSTVLIEFFSNQYLLNITSCNAAFIISTIQKPKINNYTHIVQTELILQKWFNINANISLVQIFIWISIFVVFLMCSLLISHYLLRYHKYKVAKDIDSSIDSPSCSLPINDGDKQLSAVTLMTELLFYTKLRNSKNKHVKLRESLNCQKEIEKISSESDIKWLYNQPESTKYIKKNRKQGITRNEIYNSLPTTPHLSPELLRRCLTSSSLNSKYAFLKNTNQPFIKNETSSYSKMIKAKYTAISPNINKATIKQTTDKEYKDKCNRMLVNSEFSICGIDTDLEMDYYDYNVTNAATVPGSYLGMDPSFLIWIPPIDADDPDETEIINLTSMEKFIHLDPGSNKESPNTETYFEKEVYNSRKDLK